MSYDKHGTEIKNTDFFSKEKPTSEKTLEIHLPRGLRHLLFPPGYNPFLTNPQPIFPSIMLKASEYKSFECVAIEYKVPYFRSDGSKEDGGGVEQKIFFHRKMMLGTKTSISANMSCESFARAALIDPHPSCKCIQSQFVPTMASFLLDKMEIVSAKDSNPTFLNDRAYLVIKSKNNVALKLPPIKIGTTSIKSQIVPLAKMSDNINTDDTKNEAALSTESTPKEVQKFFKYYLRCLQDLSETEPKERITKAVYKFLKTENLKLPKEIIDTLIQTLFEVYISAALDTSDRALPLILSRMLQSSGLTKLTTKDELDFIHQYNECLPISGEEKDQKTKTNSI